MAIPKNIKFKWIAAAVVLVVAVVTGILLDRWQEYIFFYREQNQIFLLDWQDIFTKVGEIGGFALVLSQFLVQFFKLPEMEEKLKLLGPGEVMADTNLEALSAELAERAKREEQSCTSC